MEEGTALLEKAVLGASPEEVRSLCGQLGVGSHSARALGLACRFRGLDMVKALIESGASFRGVNREKHGCGFMRITRWEAVNGEYYTALWEPSLMLLEPFKTIIVNGTEPVGYSEEYGYINEAEDGGALPAAERLAVLDYLLSCGLGLGFDRDRVFFYSILTDCSEFYDTLKARGAALPEKTREELINGGADWDAFSAILYFAPLEVFPRAVGRLAAELAPEEKIKYKNIFFESHKNRFTDPKNLELILSFFDRSKINQTKTLKFLIDNGAASCLAAAEKAGWLKTPKRRDELIKYSSDSGRTECAAWLLDFKDRTADLAAEREKEERKMRRELNAAPNSVAALRQIWSYTKQKDGTLRITNYKGSRTEVVVPEMIGSARVGSIGGGAFSGARFVAPRADPKLLELRAGITKVTLPEGITVIGESAFSFTSLKRVELPQSVSEIGDSAFFGCEELESITFTAREITLNSEALSGCDRLTEVVFAEGTERIRLGYDVFEGCEKLQKVSLPSTLRSVTLDGGEFFDSELFPDARVIVPRNSYAESWCKEQGINFKYLGE